jgi:tetratricopeptide (TPR) repeat protein
MQRDYVRAGPPLARAIRIYQATLGPDHPRLAILLIHDAVLKAADRKLWAAESEAKHAISLLENTLGSKSVATAWANANLAEIYLQAGKTAQAEEILPGALAIERASLNRQDGRLANTIRDMGELRMQQRRFTEAEAFYSEAMQLLDLSAARSEAARVLTQYTQALKRAGKSKAEVKSAEERLKAAGLGRGNAAG